MRWLGSWGVASVQAPQRCLVTRMEQCLVLPTWADDSDVKAASRLPPLPASHSKSSFWDPGQNEPALSPGIQAGPSWVGTQCWAWSRLKAGSLAESLLLGRARSYPCSKAPAPSMAILPRLRSRSRPISPNVCPWGWLPMPWSILGGILQPLKDPWGECWWNPRTQSFPIQELGGSGSFRPHLAVLTLMPSILNPRVAVELMVSLHCMYRGLVTARWAFSSSVGASGSTSIIFWYMSFRRLGFFRALVSSSSR